MVEKAKSESRTVSIAAILVAMASFFAAVSWISSGKAGGGATDRKTAALGFMILRLESSTEASTARVQAQTYLTQAGMYYAYADRENDENVKRYLENLGDTSLVMSISTLTWRKMQKIKHNRITTITKKHWRLRPH